MTYPYPELQNLLKFTTTPSSYLSMLGRYSSGDGDITPAKIDDAYRAIVPTYTYACCPICNYRYSAQIDTYSLAGWMGTNTGLSGNPFPLLVDYRKRAETCEHLISLHKFINLHGHDLPDKAYFNNETGEVPLVTRWCLPPNFESYAVLHGLPICTINDADFVPTYTLFFLTYFSTESTETIRRHYTSEFERGKNDKEFYPSELSYPSNREVVKPQYDLEQWSELGRLGYLDYTNPELSLIMKLGTKLPQIYRNIQGTKRGYTWRKGVRSLHIEF